MEKRVDEKMRTEELKIGINKGLLRLRIVYLGKFKLVGDEKKRYQTSAVVDEIDGKEKLRIDFWKDNAGKFKEGDVIEINQIYLKKDSWGITGTLGNWGKIKKIK